MKKTAKILTLVLSLAILCGALAISAFASDEIIGVKTHFKTDFTGGKSLGINDGTVVPEFTVDNKGSGVSNVVWDPTGGNWYFSWSYEENVGTATGNYSYTAPKPGHSWVDPNNSQVDIFEDYYWKNNKYYIFDVDIWFPKEVPGSRVTIYFLNYYVDQTEKDGTMMVGDSTESKSGINWTFTNSPSGNPLVSAGYGPKHDIFDGTWNHITGIISSEVVDNSVVLTCHTALNGTIIDVYTYTLGADAASSNNAYEGDWTLWYPKTVRIDYGGNDMNGNIVNIDNMSIRTIENHYNGNLDQVLKGGVGTKTSAWESDLYDEYNMPFSKPVAYIGTTPFDHLQKAIDAADEGAVITLAANVKSNVTINKHITIECGEFTMAPPATAPGLVYEYDPQTNVYTIANTQDVLYITWEGCVCPLCEAAGTPDPTHPGGIDAEGYLNNKISQYYEDAGKSTSWTLTNDISTYRLIGWMDDNGNVYDLDAVITQEMIDSVLLTLTPVIDVETVPIAYIKGGKTYYVTNIASAVSAADEGTTITFLDDVKLGKESSLNVTKNITIDLNGYCFDIMTSQKFSAIVVNGEKSLTITSSRPGGSILRAYPTAETKWGGTLFTTSGKDSVITLKGIKVSTAALYGNWSNLTVTLNIEDCYMNADGAGDNPSFVYHKGILTANIKNSLFKGSNNNFGINVADEGSVINAENSIFINNIVTERITTAP